mmetsp:Transcript_11582/g.44989  ORF Transcript_11582/g.44989 Transcript_11582/m.44989 type:complete len:273 (+) Transcript_11582:2088-2906(+)
MRATLRARAGAGRGHPAALARGRDAGRAGRAGGAGGSLGVAAASLSLAVVPLRRAASGRGQGVRQRAGERRYRACTLTAVALPRGKLPWRGAGRLPRSSGRQHGAVDDALRGARLGKLHRRPPGPSADPHVALLRDGARWRPGGAPDGRGFRGFSRRRVGSACDGGADCGAKGGCASSRLRKRQRGLERSDCGACRISHRLAGRRWPARKAAGAVGLRSAQLRRTHDGTAANVREPSGGRARAASGHAVPAVGGPNRSADLGGEGCDGGDAR